MLVLALLKNTSRGDSLENLSHQETSVELQIPDLELDNRKCIAPYDFAPNFEGIDAYVSGELVKLSLVGFSGKYTVILFYPVINAVSRSELVAFSDKIEKFQSIDTEVIAVSTDS